MEEPKVVEQLQLQIRALYNSTRYREADWPRGMDRWLVCLYSQLIRIKKGLAKELWWLHISWMVLNEVP